MRSGLPTMMATELPPIASRKTTKRARVPELSGTDASLAIASDRIASSPNRATASASTVMMCGSNASASAAATSATSTAGNPCDNLTSWIAAVAAGPAGLTSKSATILASATSARMVSASYPAASCNAIGVVASRPSASARRAVMTSRGTAGAQSVTNSASRCASSPSTGKVSSVSPAPAISTGLLAWNSASPRLTPICAFVPNKWNSVRPNRTIPETFLF